MAVVDDLLDYIFEGKDVSFYPEFEGWVRGSRRYREFAEVYRSKIRAKLRRVRDEDGMEDLWAELETAAVLLGEKRFTLEYETYVALKQRGPDFTATFKTHTPFNVEVRRIRSVELDDGEADHSQDGDEEKRIGKLMTVLCDKAGQMPPSIVNLLWLKVEREISEEALDEAVVRLRQMAEKKEEDFFVGRGFESTSNFLKYYRQLSGIVLWEADGHVVWLNAMARHPVPEELVKVIRRLG